MLATVTTDFRLPSTWKYSLRWLGWWSSRSWEYLYSYLSLAVRRRKLGDRHPTTISTCIQLAEPYVVLKRYDEAQKLITEARKAASEVFGPEHQETMDASTTLAVILVRRGNKKEALPILEEVLDVSRKTLGNTHPATLQSIDNAAYLLDVVGQLRKAYDLRRELRDAYRSKFGDDHAKTRAAQQGLDVLSAKIDKQGKDG